jgi:hypothetical protein
MTTTEEIMRKTTKLKITGIALIIAAFGGMAYLSRNILFPWINSQTSQWQSMEVLLIKAMPTLASIMLVLRGSLYLLEARDIERSKEQ